MIDAKNNVIFNHVAIIASRLDTAIALETVQGADDVVLTDLDVCSGTVLRNHDVGNLVRCGVCTERLYGRTVSLDCQHGIVYSRDVVQAYQLNKNSVQVVEEMNSLKLLQYNQL